MKTSGLEMHWRLGNAQLLVSDPRTRDSWDHLNLRGLNLPFMTASCWAIATQVFGNGSERLLVGRQGEHVRAMLLVTRTGRLGWQTFQPSQMPLGAWVAEADIDACEMAADALAKGLIVALSLTVSQVDPRHAARRTDGPADEQADYIETAWVEVTGTFEAYWSERGKNLRQNMRKQRKKLADDGVDMKFLAYRCEEDMAPALKRYGLIESAGWKADLGTSIHPDNEQGRFYRSLLEDAAKRGEAIVYELRFNEKVVAMNLCLVRQGLLVVLKTTYDESVDKSISPAFLLQEDVLRRLFEGDEVKRLEYYGRLRDWHTKWTDRKRMLHHLTVFRWPWVKAAAIWRRNARRRNIEPDLPRTIPTPGPISVERPG